jgi:hypothetical protein
MQGCDEFQIAIEMRLHGALGVADAARLDAHLSGCQGCRAFEVLARETEATMRDVVNGELDGVDWKVVDRMVAGWRRRNRLAAGALAVLGIIAVAEIVSLPWRENPARGFPLVALATLLALAGVGLFRWWRARRLVAAGRSMEAIAMLRAELDKRGRMVRVLGVVLPLHAALCAYLAVESLAEPGKAWLLGGAAGTVLVGWGLLWFVKRPRLARERARLDGAVASRGP